MYKGVEEVRMGKKMKSCWKREESVWDEERERGG